MIHGLALCAGVGGIELGLRLALGERYRTVGYVEREAFAASTLVARMEDEALDRAPVWDDLTTFDGRAWRGRVDLVTAGLPCQPYSVAGKQRGHDDERALWPQFVRIVEEVEPSTVFIENVPPFLKHFGPVYEELRRMGFQSAPPLFHTASECGAPHIRKRLFIYAVHSDRRELRDESGWLGRASRTEVASESGYDLPGSDDDGEGLEGWRVRGSGRADKRTARALCDSAADDDGGRREVEWGGWVFDEERETLRHDADRCSGRCRICETPWEVESPTVRVADGPAYRVDRLRAIGNGVVPLVVACAYLTLAERLREIDTTIGARR